MTGPAGSPPVDRAIVTGGAGFIGSHLVDRLVADGTEVLVIDDLSSGDESRLPDGVAVERLDIASADLEGPFERWRPSVVFHLAAQASVPRSIDDPLRDLAVNVVGTHRVVAAARVANARRLVNMSSGGAVYGETDAPATERHLPAPASYYGIHKLAAEGHVVVGGVPWANVRPANVYGPRQSAGLEGAVVAAFLDQAQTRGELRIHGDGRQTRDFVHVRDLVAALLLVGRPGAPNGVWNVGTGSPVSILELADVIAAALGRPLERVFAESRPGDVRHSSVSAAALRGLGWQPTVDLESGIRELVGRPRRPDPGEL